MLSSAQMFRLSELAQQKGDVEAALAIYAALERDPDSDVRAEARFRHAKQLLGRKRNRDAALLLRRLVDEKPGATVARLELAHALQLLGDTNSALRELRAAQASGLPPEVARLVDRYSQALRAGRSIGATLEVAVAPDSNINHATAEDSVGTIFGDFDIDGKSQAKSGIGVSLRGQAFRRFALGQNSLLATASASADVYGESQFNNLALDLSAGPEFRLGPARLNLEVGGTERWFGQKPFMRSVRIGGTFARPIGTRTQLRLSGSAALVDNQLNDLQDGRSYSGRILAERALTPTTGISLSLSGNRESLHDAGYSTTAWRTGLLGWLEIGRMTLTAEGTFGRLKADERLALFRDKRSDRYTSFSLGATFRQLQFGGFAPLLRLTAERNRSSIAFYDFKRRRTELGVVRAF